MPELLAACVVRELRRDSGSVGVTAIDKAPVPGPVRVGPFGLRSDVQADRKYHGGLEQAVYAYAQEDAEYWSAELGRELAPGWFGENLRVSGLDVNGARIGERWRIGTDEKSVVLEVTGPRSPCQTFARWVGGSDERGWVKRFSDAGRLGAYFRVVQRGRIAAGDPIEIIHTPETTLTVLGMYRG
ncbi:MAG: MOSC domain-containing protein [Leifsonia sp.]